MGIGDIVNWGTFAYWVFLAVVWGGKIWRGEATVHPVLKKLLASNVLMGVLILIGVVGQGITLYLNHTNRPYQHLAASEMEQVHDQQFLNESVELDGKNLVHCTFSGVRLVYQAKKEMAMTDNNFIGPIVIHTDNPQAEAAIDLVVNMLRESGFVNKKEVGFFKGKDLTLSKLEQPPPTLQRQ